MRMSRLDKVCLTVSVVLFIGVHFVAEWLEKEGRF